MTTPSDKYRQALENESKLDSLQKIFDKGVSRATIMEHMGITQNPMAQAKEALHEMAREDLQEKIRKVR